VPVALVGATLPDGAQIKKAKLRGVESRGMNCSARELGLGSDHAGLLILHPDSPVGLPIAQHLGLADSILDLEITPNRPDCMSMLGIAREVGAIYDKPYELPALEVSGGDAAEGATAVDSLVRVSIDDPIRCPRYTARVITGVKIGPSPDWLVERVQAAGGRSINNIVDVSNYIMYEVGQPLHAFDLDTLAKDNQGRAHIVIRAAGDGEHFTTLDGVKRVLDSDITCIVDGNASGGQGATVALAGVMGGLESEVTEATVNILLESATFSGAHTSRTSRKLQLFSEASQRYERGVDAATCADFSLRAAQLMAAVSGGVVCAGVVDVWPEPAVQPQLTFRIPRFQQFIGAEVPPLEIAAILQRLGCVVGGPDGDAFTDELSVVPPSYRPDLDREIDLYEEVLRVWGMERVPSTLPGGRQRIGEQTPEQLDLLRLNRALRACGLNETMTYAFAAPSDNEILQMPFAAHQQPVELINPMNSEQSQLRRSILPVLLRSLAYNQRRGIANVQLYETGAVFFAGEGRKLPKERQLLSAVLAGSWQDKGWNSLPETLDFFDGKGLLETALRELNISKLRFRPLDGQSAPWLQPGRAAEVLAGSQQLGWLGEIHPRVCELFAVQAPVVAFELELKTLLAAAAPARPSRDIPQFPAVQLDLAVVVDVGISAEKLQQVITSAGGSLLEEARLFDVFEDADKLGAGRKSLAFALTYRAEDRTLTLDEVEKLHSKMLSKIKGATGAEIRV
jgi:phenylalanyl-tRNA synthetase beta chain